MCDHMKTNETLEINKLLENHTGKIKTHGLRVKIPHEKHNMKCIKIAYLCICISINEVGVTIV